MGQKKEHIWANREMAALQLRLTQMSVPSHLEAGTAQHPALAKEPSPLNAPGRFKSPTAAFHPRSWRMSGVPEGRAEPIKPHMPRAAGGSVGRTRFTGAAVIQRGTQGRTWGPQQQRCQRVPKARAGCDLPDHRFPHKTDHDR